MIARTDRSPKPSLARLSRSLTLTLCAVAACQGRDAPAATTRTANGRDTLRHEPEAPTEVVIARPSTPYRADPSVAGAAVIGTVTTTGTIGSAPPVSTGADSAVCGPSIPDQSVVQQGNGLGGAVVWLDDIRQGRPLPLERRLELESDKCRLLPRVQAGVTGGAVNVLGHDPFRQHLRFLVAGEEQARAAVLLGRDEQVVPTERPFTAPGLVVVRDKDHPWPTAYIAVFDHPYYAVTAPNGTFRIDGVPPGPHRLKVWHERTKVAEQTVDVGAAGATVSVSLEGK